MIVYSTSVANTMQFVVAVCSNLSASIYIAFKQIKPWLLCPATYEAVSLPGMVSYR
jgi:hypothetical protein